MSKKVSIIIPFYNNPTTINETIASCLNSSYKNIEILIVNDGSAYRIEELLSLEYLNKVIIINQTNKGVSSARNKGVEHSTGDYILFVDADDLIDKSYIQKAVKILDDRNDIKVVTCKAVMFDQSKEKIWELPKPNYRTLLIYNVIFISSLLRKVDFLHVEGFDESLTAYEDWDFWIRILNGDNDIYRIEEFLFKYRVNQINHKSLSDIYYKNNEDINKYKKIIFLKNSRKIIEEFGHPGELRVKIERYLKKPWFKRLLFKKYLSVN